MPIIQHIPWPVAKYDYTNVSTAVNASQYRLQQGIINFVQFLTWRCGAFTRILVMIFMKEHRSEHCIKANHNELELHRQNDNVKTMAIFLLFGNGHRVERMQEFSKCPRNIINL